MPGYEHVKWNATVQEIRPQELFSYTWHPYAVEEDVDYSAETPTLVEFRLEPVKEGTRLTVRETGFDLIPAHRRPDAFRMNTLGWGRRWRMCASMSRTLPDESEAATLFAALGDGTRLALLRRLGDGERHAISRLAEGTGLTRQAVTKHLHVLENAGLVTCVRAGRGKPLLSGTRPARHRPALY